MMCLGWYRIVIWPGAFLFAVWPASFSFSRSAPQSLPSNDDTFLEAYRRADPITRWSLKRLYHEIPELKGLEPASDQSRLPTVLAGVAQNLRAFWKHFADTTSLEVIDESRRPNESNRGLGSDIDLSAGAVPTGQNSGPNRRQERFRYLMLLEPENTLKLREYRTDLQGRSTNGEAATANLAKTAGFASLPQFFDIRQQQLSDYRYLGRQNVNGASTDVVAFAEHVDPAGIKGRFIFGVTSVPILVQGIAWIDPSDFHLVRMRTDLLAPLSNSGVNDYRLEGGSFVGLSITNRLSS
jgi:hypothetical protein